MVSCWVAWFVDMTFLELFRLAFASLSVACKLALTLLYVLLAKAHDVDHSRET